MDTCHRPKIVNLSMDIEDIYGDEKILDAVLTDLILFLNNHEIPCDLYITGMRFNIMKANSDLIDLLHSNFIRCGTHTNTHSFMPISCMKNVEEICYYEGNHFDLSQKEFLINQKSGIHFIENEFKPDFFRCPGFCWSPDYFKFMKMKNYMFTTIDIPSERPFKFMGLTIMPVVYKPLEAYQSIRELDEHISKFDAVSLYLHPSRLIYDNFWDKKEQRNIHQDLSNRISYLKKIFLHFKENYKIIFLSELDNYCIESDLDYLSTDDIIKSMTSKWTWSQLPASFYSSNQIDQIYRENRSLKGMKMLYEY